MAIDTETTSLDAMQCGLVGISLAMAPGKACYMPSPIARASGWISAAKPSHAAAVASWCSIRSGWCSRIRRILKIGQNVKYDIQVLGRCEITLRPATIRCSCPTRWNRSQRPWHG